MTLNFQSCSPTSGSLSTGVRSTWATDQPTLLFLFSALCIPSFLSHLPLFPKCSTQTGTVFLRCAGLFLTFLGIDSGPVCARQVVQLGAASPAPPGGEFNIQVGNINTCLRTPTCNMVSDGWAGMLLWVWDQPDLCEWVPGTGLQSETCYIVRQRGKRKKLHKFKLEIILMALSLILPVLTFVCIGPSSHGMHMAVRDR